jgi:glycosyltransferase involved in cell wall biosynthesis
MTSDLPLTSAIVPTYDRPGQCVRAIESVEVQTYAPLELVVVETPSGTSSELPSRIDHLTSCPTTYVETEPDVGISEARNIGINRANGTYLAFLDDDDEWLPEKTETQVDRLEASPKQVRVSITGNMKIGLNGETISTHMPPQPENVVAYQLCSNVGSFSMRSMRRYAVWLD